jgi:predicted dehydrogenase
VGRVVPVHAEPEGIARVQERFGIEGGYTDAVAMLAAEDLGAVVVASPHVWHAEHALLAVSKGLPVLVEKPMATTAIDARRLADAASARGVPVMIPHGWNFLPMMDAAHRIVAEGRIGEVRHVCAQMASALADLFAGEPMAETTGALFRPPPSTWADPARAGGYGWGQLSHLLGALFRLIDLDPDDVYARTGLSPARVDYYDAAVLTLSNGATVVLSGAGTVPKARGFQVDLRLFGTEGMMLLDFERPRLEVVRHDGEVYVEPFSPGAADYDVASPARRLVDLALGRPVVNPADGTVGLRATLVLDAMYRSAVSGRPERVP